LLQWQNYYELILFEQAPPSLLYEKMALVLASSIQLYEKLSKIPSL